MGLRKMKVLLIKYHPEKIINAAKLKPIISVEGITPPLGLAYIAAVLEKEGYNVKILDCQILNLDINGTKDEIKRYDPDVVGITCMTPILHGVLEVAKLAKEINGNIKIAIGGPHLSIFPEETVSFPFVDFGIMGEGEYIFLDLIKVLEKNNKKFEDIDGLVWKNNGKVIINKRREPIFNLDKLPFPARHLLQLKKYEVIIMKYPMTTMVASRGCPFHCSYCFKDFHTRIYRTRSAKNVVDEMEECVNKFKVKEIGFYDDCWPNKQLLKDICKEIINRGLDIAWESPQRVDLVNEYLLKLMHKAGCERLRFGVESGSERLLAMIKKGNLQQIKNAFKLSKKAGIETFAFFMISYPTETYNDFLKTLDLAKKIDADWAVFGATLPYPGTKLWEQAVNEFNYDKNYWHEWSLGIRNDQIPYFSEDAEEKCRLAYREFYIRLNFMFKKILKIRSWYDIKRYWRGFQAIRQFKM